MDTHHALNILLLLDQVPAFSGKVLERRSKSNVILLPPVAKKDGVGLREGYELELDRIREDGRGSGKRFGQEPDNCAKYDKSYLWDWRKGFGLE